jgi:processive 1,2-diacylglycerol beta-glucosyltransferase
MTTATQCRAKENRRQRRDDAARKRVERRSPRILVLWASTGNGHISVSRALETACCAEDMEVMSVDALRYGPNSYRAWYGGGYELVVRCFPWLWGMAYRLSDEVGPWYYLQTGLDFLFLNRLEKLVLSFRPDWVICTHSLPQPRLERIRARLKNFRVGVVVTDFYPHSMWRRGNPDHYFVPSEWSREQLDALLPGFAARTFVTGIPTDARFAERPGRHAARRALGLRPELPTMLLTSGGIGGGPLLAAAKALASLNMECQVVVVCGRNEGAYRCLTKHLVSLNADGRVRFRVEGYINADAMANLMHASDFLIGKPGGSTMAEALTSGCPLVVYTPVMIPGQEEFNAEMLQRAGAARIAGCPEELRATVNDLLAAPTILEEMRAAAERIARPTAAVEIVNLLTTL